MREQLKLEPTKADKMFLKGQQEALLEIAKENKEEEKLRVRSQVQDVFCMGINKKSAKGANPLSMMRRRTPKVISKDEKKRKRRPRKGKRSKALSALKKQQALEKAEG